MNTLYFVVPCYNEQDVLPETAKQLGGKLHSLIESKKVSSNSKIVFVNDGSHDNTWEIINDLHMKDKLFSGINLSRNRGHQNALLAGLMTAKEYADIVITIDADLQQDIEAVDIFLEKYSQGFDIVYGVRKARNTDSWFKKTSALFFYKLMNFWGCDVIKNHADYRLMSKRAIEALSEFKEVNLFLRGLVPLIGFKSDVVYFDVSPRFAGESKYTLAKMISFAINGITSLSIKPIRFFAACGLSIFVVSLIMLVYLLVAYFCKQTVSGWTTIVVSVWAIGGLQLLGIGIIGEYVGKTYMEVKSRPRYIIEKFLNDEIESKD